MFCIFQLSKIQASIKSKDFKQHGDSIEEGASYTIDKLLVSFNKEGNFKPTNHKYKLTLIGSTSSNKIPANLFNLAKFQEIISGTDNGVLMG